LDVTTADLRIATVGRGLQVAEGANAKAGVATLVAGTVTVNTTAVTANSRIQLTGQADGGTPGFQRVSARVAGTSFTITSSNAADTSQVAWLIVEP
jgi:imidazolonepropionase-like amidohydrolase